MRPLVGQALRELQRHRPVEPRKEPNFSYRLLRGIYPVFRLLFPNQVIRADDLARVMVDAVISRTGQGKGPVYENRDIRAMALRMQHDDHGAAESSSG